ncbi:hypothetical protein NP493_112g02000 [Ridgeia piscesae]|uniref:Uncharacterized protein n=1 Tax=Ridgeia piscesae TaxID=27915 RepID=A0AAD9UH22_RIDPI|nr:hypothetical protein NP493_112g02000 [Ridgeia piscesae]
MLTSLVMTKMNCRNSRRNTKIGCSLWQRNMVTLFPLAHQLSTRERRRTRRRKMRMLTLRMKVTQMMMTSWTLT